jgi:hypothetical protein
MRWGATTAEQTVALPGDDLLQAYRYRVTRAIGIDAPPEAVWPWIAQVGAGRGGWYTFDAVANLGTAKPTHSAREILPQFQNIAVGDPIDVIDRIVFRVAEVDPGHCLVLVADARNYPSQPWTSVWTVALLPEGPTGTRLLLREATTWRNPAVGLLIWLSQWVKVLVVPKALRTVRDLAAESYA